MVLLWSVPVILLLAALVAKLGGSLEIVGPVALALGWALFLVGIWSPPPFSRVGAGLATLVLLYLGAVVDFLVLVASSGFITMLFAHRVGA